MRVLVRCSRTGRYLGDFDRWVDEAESAYDFSRVVDAEQAVRRERMTGMEAVLVYDSPVCELRVALREW
jgi:hypothetical protein